MKNADQSSHEFTSLDALIQTGSTQSFYVPTKSIDATKEKELLEVRIKRLNDLINLRTRKNCINSPENKAAHIDDLNDSLKTMQDQYDNYDDILKRQQEDEARRTQFEADIKQRAQARTNQQQEVKDLRNYLESLDDGITSLFLSNDANNSFRLNITIAFAALVGIVIAGFFVIAATERAVRISIFSNDSGLQFVTLFSLIIAIILFGVVNILEGKELSALLGGLSGYILGRGSLGRRDQPAAPAPPTHPDVTGQPG